MSEGEDYKTKVGECPVACEYKDKVSELEITEQKHIKEKQQLETQLREIKEEIRGKISEEKRGEIYTKLEEEERVVKVKKDNEILHSKILELLKDNNELIRKLELEKQSYRELIAQYDESRLNSVIKGMRSIVKEERKKVKLLSHDRLTLERINARLQVDKNILEDEKEKLISDVNSLRSDAMVIKERIKITKKANNRSWFPRLKFKVEHQNGK